VYAWAVSRIEQSEDIEFDEWDEELHDLLPWQDGENEYAIQRASDDFMAMMATNPD